MGRHRWELIRAAALELAAVAKLDVQPGRTPLARGPTCSFCSRRWPHRAGWPTYLATKGPLAGHCSAWLWNVATTRVARWPRHLRRCDHRGHLEQPSMTRMTWKLFPRPRRGGDGEVVHGAHVGGLASLRDQCRFGVRSASACTFCLCGAGASQEKNQNGGNRRTPKTASCQLHSLPIQLPSL